MKDIIKPFGFYTDLYSDKAISTFKRSYHSEAFVLANELEQYISFFYFVYIVKIPVVAEFTTKIHITLDDDKFKACDHGSFDGTKMFDICTAKQHDTYTLYSMGQFLIFSVFFYVFTRISSY